MRFGVSARSLFAIVIAALVLIGGATFAQAPPVGSGDLPPGHPPVDDPPPQDQGHAQGVAEAPADEVLIDPELRPGTVVITILDAAGRRVPSAPIELDIDKNTVAQGESHSFEKTTASERGEARFDGLRSGAAMFYRVRTTRGEATFSSEQFSLKEKSGVQVVLHAYDPVSALEQATFAVEAYVLLDIKQDTIRVNHLLHTYNLGQTAYVPHGLTLKLPPGARAFNQEQAPDDITMAENAGVVEITGTFPPGQAELAYAYTLPLEDGATARLLLPLPPRILAAQVSVSAGPGMELEIAGFPKAELGKRRDGQRVLQTVKQLDPRQNPAQFFASVTPGDLDMTIRGLPTRGWGPTAAALLAALALIAGLTQLGMGRTAGQRRDLQRELSEARDALLDEICLLERAHKTGEVGPKSYERLRTALLDALARIIVRIDAQASAKVPARP